MELEISDLDVTYSHLGKAVRAVKSVSLGVGEGVHLGLLGESGCGKTTLARAAAGILPESALVTGTIRFRGELLPNEPGPLWRRRRRSGISVISQEPRFHLNPLMSALRQVAEVHRAHGASGRSEREQRAAWSLIRAGLDRRLLRSYPHQLSGGECQRVVIAQALAAEPSVLIADEPTSSLDSCAQFQILELLRGLTESDSLSVMLTSHDPAILASITANVAVMYAGRIVECGPTAEVLRNPLHPFTRLLLECHPRARRSPAQRQPVIQASLPAETGCSFFPKCPDRSRECAAMSPCEQQVSPNRLVRCLRYAN